MALDTSGMMLRLGQLSPLGSPSPGAGASMERERLKLMREQFENTKQEQQRAHELSQIEENGRMERERMQGGQAAAQRDAAAVAKTQEVKRTAYQQFSELNGKGDVEGARALVPYMNSLGMSVDLLGEEAGLPKYQIEMEPNAVRNVEEPTAAAQGIGTTEEAFGRALDASKHFEATGQPARAAETPDNVIDLQAMQKQTLQRLDPRSLAGAYPEGPTRDSAMVTAESVRGMGLPASKSAEMFDKLRSGPDAQARAEIEAGAQQSRFDETRAASDQKQNQALYNRGFKTMGESTGKLHGIQDLLTGRTQATRVRGILENDVDSDDDLALAYISRRMGERGATTEGDIKRVTGMSAQSWLDQLGSFFEKGTEGGLPRDQKQGLINVLKEMEASDTQRFRDFADEMEGHASHGDTDPEVAKGIRAYVRVAVPRDIRESLESERKGAKTGGAPKAGPKAFNMEEDSRQGATTIPQESRIAFEHNNPGNLKFADQTGATKGEPAEDGGNWAKFESTDDGLEALRAQIEKDADRDLTIREFVSKYAPKGSNDTETYIKQATKELRAEEGDKLSDVDVYDVLRFVAKKESGTELPGQYSDEPEEPEPAFAKPGNGVPPPASSGADRIRELLKKGGY